LELTRYIHLNPLGTRQYSEARSLFAWLAVEEVGHPAAEVARFLGISRMGVHKAVTRGFELKRIHLSLE
jgi:hypothetical protein